MLKPYSVLQIRVDPCSLAVFAGAGQDSRPGRPSLVAPQGLDNKQNKHIMVEAVTHSV